MVSILLGMPARDWRAFTTQEVIEKPLLQIALGMSIGQGIGSLFGDNIVAEVIGLAAGVPVTLVIGVGSGIVGFLQWVFGRPSIGVTPSASAAQVPSAESHYFQSLPAAVGSSAASAIIIGWQPAEVAADGLQSSAGQLVLQRASRAF